MPLALQVKQRIEGLPGQTGPVQKESRLQQRDKTPQARSSGRRGNSGRNLRIGHGL
jgi:hypothetical protein